MVSTKPSSVSSVACQTVEFWGIEPNPKVETLRKAIALGKQEGVTFVLAVGGGSVLDASKLIVNAIPSERDAWDLVLHGADRSVQTLPLGTVLTIPATGSEMNRGAVSPAKRHMRSSASTTNIPYSRSSIQAIPTPYPTTR